QNSSGVNHPSLLENFRGLKFLSGLIFVRDAKAYRTSDKLKLIGHDSAEVLDQHDVTVEWILFGVQDLMRVWVNRNTRNPVVKPSQRHYRPYALVGKPKQFNCRTFFGSLIYEIDTFISHRPMSPLAGCTSCHHRFLVASISRSTPDARTPSLAVVDPLLVSGFKRGEASLFGYLYRRTSRDRPFPNLQVSSPC